MKNLARWTFASIAKHFQTTAGNIPLPYFVEGIDEREPDTSRQNHCELRITGPYVREESNSYYSVEVVINIMLTDLMEMESTNAYNIAQWAGDFQAVMLEPIPVYKYGDGADDDDSLIGCLRVKDGNRDAVRVFHFGQLTGTDRVRQSEVDGLYRMEVLSATL